MKNLLVVCAAIFLILALSVEIGYPAGDQPREGEERGDVVGAVGETPPVSILGDIKGALDTQYCPIDGRTYSSKHTYCPDHPDILLKPKSEKGY